MRADEAFTNRSSQLELVAAALTEHLQHISGPGFDAEDLEGPRANALVFHRATDACSEDDPLALTSLFARKDLAVPHDIVGLRS
ncbi:hypothetical protein ACIRD9_41490 [Streptomyces violaceus]|uniref:hypothetical protein n=1 Tax=Streptomyces violaceus TaxID=1936 RepID=UPI003805385F